MIHRQQYVCFTIDELFNLQDRLNQVEDDKSQIWNLFNEFLNEALEDSFDDECCHTCSNCISDEEEHLTCIYDNKSKDFDDVCDRWELDKDMV